MPGYEDVPVAVLGAAGFIGRWIARKLFEQHAQLYLVVRDAVRANLLFAEDGIRGHVIEADLCIPESVGTLYRRIRPAVTFNLAGYGVDPSETGEEMAWRMNARLPETLCECVAEWKHPSWRGRHIVHAGSAAEYGKAGGDLAEDGPALPTTLYGRTKLQGTRVLAEGGPALGLRAITARLFTVYGPGEHPGRLLPALLQAARTGRPLELSAGTQCRDFTYIEDVAEGMLRLGRSAGDNTIVNLATGRLTSVRTFAETAAGILGIACSNLRFGAGPPGLYEMQHDPVSLARLQELVAWTPPTSIPAGIRKTIEFLGRSSDNP